jgi:beta-glucosidase/6-phospho-beta-glucosidase/beta-galactosidase
MARPELQSFILGGFECSTHRRFDGRRLDMIDATAHDRFALEDYRRLTQLGIGAARDGLRWHLIETTRGKYDFSSVEMQLIAAETTGVRVIWDLFHYGYPDDIDIFSAEFPDRFAAFAAAFASYHRRVTGRAAAVVPINEISFYSWIAGEEGKFHPYAVDRGDELKLQLVRSAITGIKAMRSVEPDTFIMSSEPAVNVISRPEEPWFAVEAENYRRSQYQAIDMLTGLLDPHLGGETSLIDMIGVNYYPHNQWFFPDREMVPMEDPLYRPLGDILREVYERYDTPLVISETGTEDERRRPWFRYVVDESRRAINAGVDLRGVCIYPIVNHPGWVDERHCYNGLWDYADERGERPIFEPLACEIRSSLGNTATRAAH